MWPPPATGTVPEPTPRMRRALPSRFAITVRAYPPDAAERFVRIEVADQGPGVPAEFLPRLFQKFSQADSSSSRRLSGTGLGLAISKELMDRMGGDIGYQPNSPTGACFYIDLPVQ